MSGIFLRWGIPALVTVVGGTSLAISATSGNIAADLASRTEAALSDPRDEWVTVTFDARDAIVSGTATDQEMIDAAIARVAAVRGVRSVQSRVVLAEFVSPFPFSASIRDGEISLSGGVPDETAHARVLLATGSADDSLRILSGAPRREVWQAAVDYALAHLTAFDEGTVVLEDLNLTISGRARSPQAFDDLAILDGGAPPAGVTVVRREVVPALAAPFEWRAEFDGTRVAVSGYTATESFAESLRAAGVDGRPIATSLVLASGAPDGFEEQARLLLENLVLLERGSAIISDATATLSGEPADERTVETLKLAAAGGGFGLDLAPPRADVYQFAATRTASGIVLSGYVPDEATRERLDAIEGVSAGGLELARGAPERFDSGVEFGLQLLRYLSQGSFTLRNTTVSLEGRAATLDDFEKIENELSFGPPQGLILSSAQVKPPLATPFVWSAKKGADGRVRISGFVPSRAVRNALQAATTGLDVDSSTVADGSPENFVAEATAALGVLPFLKSGAIEYDGTRWSLTGAVESPQAGLAADQAFAASGLRDAGWDYVLDLPDAPPAAVLPVIDPYVWRAQKGSDGAVALAGFVPTDGLKRVLAFRAGADAADRTSLGAGNPPGFIPGAVAALDALVALDEGAAGFDGRTWSLRGTVPTTAKRLEVEGRLMAAVDTAGWTLAIQARDAAPVVSNYTWSATKAADGRFRLAGHITSEEQRSFVAVRAGQVAEDTMTVASGEPAGFLADILAGLEALKHLETGTAKFEAGAWTLSGVPQTAASAELALAALDAASTGGSNWTKQLAAPVVAPEPVPVSEPELELPASEPEVAAVPEEPADTAEEAAPPVADAPQTEGPSSPAESGPDLEVADLPDAVEPAEPEPESEPVPPPRDFAFLASKPLDGPFVLEGGVPTESVARFFGVLAGSVPTTGLAVNEGLPTGFIANASAGIRLLAELDDGRFGLDRGTWVLEGRVESEARRAEVMARLAALPSAVAGWETSIALLPPVELCRRHVDAFAGRNAILFQSGSARIASESLSAIDELAVYLGECPETQVYVEGHTDADGADDLNLALSVARAEAVVEALIERGIGFQRLYAVGYGESLPIASNETSAGKQANRRIAFSIVDE